MAPIAPLSVCREAQEALREVACLYLTWGSTRIMLAFMNWRAIHDDQSTSVRASTYPIRLDDNTQQVPLPIVPAIAAAPSVAGTSRHGFLTQFPAS